jgi:hypothetical protein
MEDQSTSTVAPLLKRVTSLRNTRRSSEPSLFVARSKHLQLSLSDKRCETRRGSARHGRARLSTEKTPLRLLLPNRGKVFRRYSSCMEEIRYIAPSLRLFVPSSQTVCDLSFLPRTVLSTSSCKVLFPFARGVHSPTATISFLQCAYANLICIILRTDSVSIQI